ncbi:hypothetical protein [Rhizobium paknamense]|uniref:Uncharacterized protein n=1 Tax=Rhizobium paknamense TaxID=1206817 RepID=A0ABU0IAC2_9HYPH|nr:hypothetical protein [Rhizobium paknamense]MDQ0455173.1 hypothetical protein [Rhizobium paknamense]
MCKASAPAGFFHIFTFRDRQSPAAFRETRQVYRGKTPPLRQNRTRQVYKIILSKQIVVIGFRLSQLYEAQAAEISRKRRNPPHIFQGVFREI